MTENSAFWRNDFRVDIAIIELRKLLSELRMIHIQEVLCDCLMFVLLTTVVLYFYKKNKISKQQLIGIILLGLYLELLFALTVLLRIPRSHPLYKLQLFWSWKYVIQNGSLGLLIDNILNLFMLFPIGCSICLIGGKVKVSYVIIIGVILSGIIELAQLFLCRGYFEWDDILHNVFGCCLGYYVMLFANKLTRKNHHPSGNGNYKS